MSFYRPRSGYLANSCKQACCYNPAKVSQTGCSAPQLLYGAGPVCCIQAYKLSCLGEHNLAIGRNQSFWKPPVSKRSLLSCADCCRQATGRISRKIGQYEHRSLHLSELFCRLGLSFLDRVSLQIDAPVLCKSEVLLESLLLVNDKLLVTLDREGRPVPSSSSSSHTGEAVKQTEVGG